MKRDIIIFITNIIILFSFVGMIINFSPYFSSFITKIATSVNSFCNPYEDVKEVSDIISQIILKNNENTTNTSSKEKESETKVDENKIEVAKPKQDLDLTKVPDDVQKLMDEEKINIKSKSIIGKTSEENYTGGGEIVSFGNVSVQNKIPSSFYQLNIENLLNQKAELEIKDLSKPTILIYHSHTTESYTLLDEGCYRESSSFRSKDNARNMARVGDEICKVLESKGFNVIHDKEIHDLSYNDSYDSSRKTMLSYLEKYPSIEITIDVHRDSITYKNKTKVKPTIEINGKKSARMMIISGCEYGRVKNFPDWESNLKFSTAVTNKINTMYPNLMRPIMFSERKYNMDLTKNSFLLEVGTDANTLDEACYAGRLFANALGDLLLEEYVKE